MALTPSLLFQRDKANKTALLDSSAPFRPALLVVNLQNDFSDPDNGLLPMHEGALDLAPKIDSLLKLPGFNLRIATLSCPPEQHKALGPNVEMKTPGQAYTDLRNTKQGFEHETVEQKIWPRHCRPGSWGIELISGIDRAQFDIFLKMNMHPEVVMQSAFKDVHGNTKKDLPDGSISHDLEEELHAKNITHVYCAGTWGDYFLSETAIDAVALGFTVYVIEDVVKSFDSTGEDWSIAVGKMRMKNVHIVKLHDPEVQRVKTA